MNRKIYLSIFISAIVCLAMGFLTGCGSSSKKAPVIAITASSGTPQSTIVGTAFAKSLVANVTSNGAADTGVTVTFSAPANTGASCTLSATTATTDANGNASVTCTADSTAGAYSVSATTTGAATPASFSLTNNSVTITAGSGTPQGTAVGMPFAKPLVANVSSGGTVLSGATVTFSAPATTGGTASCTLSATTATTDANGNASVTCTADSTTGTYNVTATTTGATTPATFVLTNNSVSIAASSGGGQSTTVGTAFPNALIANVTSGGAPLSGATVTFAVPGSGASCTLSSTTATTDANGNAQITCTANTTAGGPYNVTATTAGAATPATFALTNNPGAVATINVNSGTTPQNATVNTQFATPLSVTVDDQYANPVSGATVTFTVPSTGQSCTPSAPTATTVANGTASITCTANTTAGSYTVMATVAGVATAANFSLTNNPGTAATITASTSKPTSTPQGTATGRPFPNALQATVADQYSNPLSGVSVTFGVPGSGASCTPSSTTPVTTDVNGNVSITCTANSNAGAYTVTASSGTLTPANFNLTNGTAYTFYASGEEAPNANNGNAVSYYAVAGVVFINIDGSVGGGIEDYNDGPSITQTGLAITGGSLAVSGTTGQGTLTLITNNGTTTQFVGVAGTETFAIQFVNLNHALIAQFDGSATSSGSLDLQTLTAPSGNFAFTMSGTDTNDDPVGYGGLLTITSGAGGETLSGTADVNDAGGSPNLASQGPAGNLAGTLDAADAVYGRGLATASISTSTVSPGPLVLSLAYYIVGPEVLRIIDVDVATGTSGTGGAALGSAYGQGCTTCAFDSTALGKSSVFGFQQSDPVAPATLLAVAGSFATASTVGVANGTFNSDPANTLNADADVGYGGGKIMFSGIYTIGSNGYGSLTNTAPGVIGLLGLYVTDPKLNLLDPNSPPATTTASGALLLNLDAAAAGPLSGGVGMLIPQTDTKPADFENNTYAVVAHDYNDTSTLPSTGTKGDEFDFVGQAPFSTLALTGATAEVNDPFAFFNPGTAFEYNSGTLKGTVAPYSNEATNGRYSTNSFVVAPSSTVSVTLFLAIYQANGGQLFWVNPGASSMFFGTLQQQGSLTGLPKADKAAATPLAKQKQ